MLRAACRVFVRAGGLNTSRQVEINNLKAVLSLSKQWVTQLAKPAHSRQIYRIGWNSVFGYCTLLLTKLIESVIPLSGHLQWLCCSAAKQESATASLFSCYGGREKKSVWILLPSTGSIGDHCIALPHLWYQDIGKNRFLNVLEWDVFCLKVNPLVWT